VWSRRRLWGGFENDNSVVFFGFFVKDCLFFVLFFDFFGIFLDLFLFDILFLLFFVFVFVVCYFVQLLFLC